LDEWDSSTASSTTPIFGTTPMPINFAELPIWLRRRAVR
jgi:hypothetical protein